MLAYNPGVYDRSGEIIAEGANRAAEIQLQSMSNMGENIGNALAMFAEAYKEKEQDKSDAKIYGNLLKFIAPAFGQQGDAILAEYNTLKSDRDKANFGRTAASLLGPASNAMMAQGRLGVQQNAPFVDQYLDTQNDIASGNRTITPGAGDPANTVPLPSEDAPLPAIQGAPRAAPSSVPGGRASWDARNRDRQKRGLQPLPYPPGLE